MIEKLKKMIKSILVTGATGKQVGSTSSELLKFGFQVKALVRDKYSNESKKLDQFGDYLIKGNWWNL